MKSTYSLAFTLTTLLAWESGSLLCFSFAPTKSLLINNGFKHAKITSTELGFAKKSHSEYSVVEDDEEEDGDENMVQSEIGKVGDFFAVDNRNLVSSDADNTSTPGSGNNNKNKQKPEYGALSPGTVVQIQVGDVSLARKAWKKRRRTGSPLLIPCSVLNVEHSSMVRWNLIYLLEKFGQGRPGGVEISAAQLSKRYRTYLKSSLSKQAEALGHESNNDLISTLFNKKAQESYGVQLIEDSENGSLTLKAPISKYKAQKRSAGVPLLQFRKHRKGDHGDSDTLTHTGCIRAKKDDGDYGFLPLSAALRVSQKDDLDSGRVEENNFHPAVIHQFEPIGDSGSPLLTLSLDPRGVRDSLKIKPDKRHMPLENPEHMLEDLSAGDGPFKARVVRLAPGKALVDFEVGRKVSSQGVVKVLGGLHFQDSVEILDDGRTKSFAPDFIDEVDSDDDMDDSFNAIDDVLFEFGSEDDDDEEDQDDGTTLVEDLLSLRSSDSFEEGTFEDGEEEEDISNLFALKDDGSLTYNDPDSGEDIVLESDDEDYQEMLKVQALIDSHASPTSTASSDSEDDSSKNGKNAGKSETAKTEPVTAAAKTRSASVKPRFKSKRLHVGDFVDVYIRSVSKQSRSFTVTTNPLVQGRTAKDIKKESDAQKKLKRLKKSLGGSLKRIWDLEGQECTGTVKATSDSGNWIYVKPELNGLPVGIAALEEGVEGLLVGDHVQVQIAGVDEQRGQLSMKYIGKLRP